MTADIIEAKLEDTLGAFKMECILESEIAAAREDLRRIVEEKRKVEELERKAKEVESDRLLPRKRDARSRKRNFNMNCRSTKIRSQR